MGQQLKARWHFCRLPSNPTWLPVVLEASRTGNLFPLAQQPPPPIPLLPKGTKATKIIQHYDKTAPFQYSMHTHKIKFTSNTFSGLQPILIGQIGLLMPCSGPCQRLPCSEGSPTRSMYVSMLKDQYSVLFPSFFGNRV